MDLQDEEVCATSLSDEEGGGPTTANARGILVLHDSDSRNSTGRGRSEPRMPFSSITTCPLASSSASISQQQASADDVAPLAMAKDPSRRVRPKSLRRATTALGAATTASITRRARSAFDPAFRSLCPDPSLLRIRSISSESSSSTRSSTRSTTSSPQESCSYGSLSPPPSTPPPPQDNLRPPSSEEASPVVFSPCDSTSAPPPETFHVQEVYLVGESPRTTNTSLYTLEEEGEDVLGNSCMTEQHHRQSVIRRTSTASFDDELEIEFDSSEFHREGKFHRRVRLSLIIGAVVCIIAGSVLLASHFTKTRMNAADNKNSNGAINTPTQEGNDDDVSFWADSDEAIAYLRELRFTVLGIDTFRAGPIQLLATEWMAYTDTPPFGTRVPLEDLTRVVQRYALLVLHFANGGGKGWGEMMWANPGSHECEWMGIECNSKGHIEALNLGSNVDLTGELMDEIGLLSSLTSLDLRYNRLEGSIPTSLYSLTNLIVLHLEQNEFAGYIADSIEMLTDLEELWLSFNYLSGTLPVSLQSIENLKIFDIGNNRFQGEIWSFLPAWSNIETFSIDGNTLRGTIPTEIGELSHLSWIDLSYTATVGTIPTEIGLCPSLELFRTSFSSVDGSIPSEIGNLSLLGMLKIRGATLGFASTFPTELGSCTSLTDLAVSDNSLKGTIPSELGQLTKLVSLIMAGNELEGTIPTEFALLTNLWFLDLRGRNQELTGTMPVGICEIDTMTGLYTIDSVECSCCHAYT